MNLGKNVLQGAIDELAEKAEANNTVISLKTEIMGLWS